MLGFSEFLCRKLYKSYDPSTGKMKHLQLTLALNKQVVWQLRLLHAKRRRTHLRPSPATCLR